MQGDAGIGSAVVCGLDLEGHVQMRKSTIVLAVALMLVPLTASTKVRQHLGLGVFAGRQIPEVTEFLAVREQFE